MIRIRPRILSVDPQKNLAPKLDLFRTLGISNTDLVKFICSNPFLLRASAKNRMIACHRYLKSLLHSDEDVATVIKRRSGILFCNIDKVLAPHISLLREIGVPESRIRYMLIRHTRVFMYSLTHFKSKVEELVSLRFDPLTIAFLDALGLLYVLKKTTIDRKWAAFRKGNLSDDEIRAIFRAFPNCMAMSEEKITRTMDFLVNKMGFEAARVTAWPVCIAYNLQKRIIPRCRVIKVLLSHELVKKDIHLSSFLPPSKPIFLKKFVSEYEGKVPGLLKIYEGKMVSSETGTVSDDLDVTK